VTTRVDLPSSGSLPITKVLLAPDKFKGSLPAAEVAARLSAGLVRAGFDGQIVSVPVADGGVGTVDAAVAAGFKRVDVPATGPTGQLVTASFALRDGVAVIEAAQACGLVLLPPGEFAPLTATTRGVGELIRAAAGLGATRIVLGVGGSATTDGGAGLLQALGARLTDSAGQELPPGGAALSRLAALDLSRLADLSAAEFQLASDVDNPLLGPSGAAAVYGPQKGASPQDVTVLEAGLARWADVAEAAVPGGPARDAAGAGAAGGLGFAAMLFLGARMRPGIELLLELASFGTRLDGAGLVITGEGSLDEQTLRGKAPVGVVRAVAAHDPGLPVIAVAGRRALTAEELHGAGIAAAYALTDIEPDIARCIADAGPLLERLAGQVAADWLG
jgi:glycerate 2-kinase